MLMHIPSEMYWLKMKKIIMEINFNVDSIDDDEVQEILNEMEIDISSYYDKDGITDHLRIADVNIVSKKDSFGKAYK